MRKLTLFLLFLSFSSNCLAAIYVVQKTTYVPAATGSTMPFALPSTPKVGDILIACTSYSQYTTTRTIAAPNGNWNQIDNANGGVDDSMATWWYIVRQGDTGNYTFTISGTVEWYSGVLYEFSGVSPTAPINKHSIIAGTAATITTTAITPSIYGTYPLSCADTDPGSSQGQVLNSVSAGWKVDLSAVPQYHTTYSSYHGMTTDTVTAMSNTFTFSIAPANGALAAAILLTPQNHGFCRFLKE